MGVAYGAYAAAFVVGSSLGGFVIEGFGLRAPFALYLATSALAAILVAVLGGRRGRGPGGPPRRGGDAPDRHDQSRAGPGAGASSRTRPASSTSTGSAPSSRSCPRTGRTGRCRRAASACCSGPTGSRGSSARSAPAGYRTRWAAGWSWCPRCSRWWAAWRSSWRPLGVWALFLGAVALGLAAGASAPTCVGLIADHASAAQRGTAMGLFEAACGVSILALGSRGRLRRRSARRRGAVRDRRGLRAGVGRRARPGAPGPRPRLIRTVRDPRVWPGRHPAPTDSAPQGAAVRLPRAPPSWHAPCSRRSEPWTRASGAGGSSDGAARTARRTATVLGAAGQRLAERLAYRPARGRGRRAPGSGPLRRARGRAVARAPPGDRRPAGGGARPAGERRAGPVRAPRPPADGPARCEEPGIRANRHRLA